MTQENTQPVTENILEHHTSSTKSESAGPEITSHGADGEGSVIDISLHWVQQQCCHYLNPEDKCVVFLRFSKRLAFVLSARLKDPGQIQLTSSIAQNSTVSIADAFDHS